MSNRSSNTQNTSGDTLHPDKLHAVKLFNTLTRTVDTLKTVEPGAIKLYCCGPTVYNFQHIGNLRTYIFEDILTRTLRYAGYRVTHVMNITDVGHLVSDADVGEDKMLVAAKREGKKSEEIADYYTQIFFNHCKLLNINRPDVVCKATEHVKQMIELIKKLEVNELAYLSGGNVYFDVSKFPEYGKLAKLDLESLKAGARIEVDSNKRNALDFALWFTKSKFENQELQWESPWGRGYPGWHIECSAMAMNYLGEELDIHCGGIDHIPVHHTNEIAQSEGATKKPFARVWMHGGFLVTEKNKTGQDKMSKSTGDFLTLDRLIEKKIDPLAYRLFCLGGNYRQELSWSWEGVDGASKTLAKLRRQIAELKAAESTSTKNESLIAEHRSAFQDALFNDLGTAKGMAVFYAVVRDTALSSSERLSLALEFDRVLGLGIETWDDQVSSAAADLQALGGEVAELLEQRELARKSKNWKEADRLRDRMLELGYEIVDSSSGPQVKKTN